MIASIDTSLIDWSRAQFALTAMYHWLFVPLTLGLGVIQAIMETIYTETGDSKYRASLLLRKMVRAGYLGRKTGKGFYDYSRK